MPTREELTSQSNQLQVQIAVVQDQFSAKLNSLRSLQNAGEDTSKIEIELDNLRQQKNELTDNLNLTEQSIGNIDQSQDSRATVKSPEATNSSQTDAQTEKKYQNSEIVGTTDEFGDLEGAIRQQQNTSGLPVVDETGTVNPNLKINPETGELYRPVSASESPRQEALATAGVPPAAEKLQVPAAEVKVQTLDNQGSDNRVRIRVPDIYLRSRELPGIDVLKSFNGILFPFTPQIGFEQTANYTSQQPMHSNFAFNFYQRSFTGSINIVADFAVQNNYDAEIYLGTIHLLSALTKMRFGNDSNAGSPPPVCRLDAFGDYLLKNVPIAISSFRIDLPKNVDYYSYTSFNNKQNTTLVPITSQLNITCVLMYSRQEMQKFTVDAFVNSPLELKRKGFL